MKIGDVTKDRFPEIVYDKGDVIFRRGDESKYVYRVLSGRIGIYNDRADGNTERIVWALPGESIGEMEVLAGVKEVVFEAEAYEDGTRVQRIEKNDYLEMLRQDNDFCFEAVCVVAKKLYTASDNYCQRTTKTAYERIRGFLADMSVKYEGDGVKVLPFTRGDIADNCGTSERTVNRCIKKLRDAGMLSIVKGKVAISGEQRDSLMKINKLEDE